MDETKPIGRRTFLAVVTAGLSSLVWGDPVWRAVRSALGPLEIAGVPGAQGGWRIFTVNPPMPVFRRARWRLRIEGLVDNPMTLTYEDLLALPSAQQTSDFHCVTGWSVYDVRWRGVRFADLLAAARLRPEAGALSFYSAEKPYVDSLTIDQAMQPDAMLAYAMDGRPLKREHGAPARVVMPRMYGYKNVKWVDRIVVTRTQLDGYWEERGYDRDAWV
ncbi:MAG TPA: molybdopterin-dependent oxidoreductase [Gaiellaceae bacterium]|nr:molybdopterin-dependent oxidoreductase [Gaiellaceae bacterium]